MVLIHIPTFESIVTKTGDSYRLSSVWERWFLELPMVGTPPPAPTYASPIEVDPVSGDKKFSAVWMDWLLKLSTYVKIDEVYQPAPTYTEMVEFEPKTDKAVMTPAWIDWWIRLPN
jgi:hypothetical protein